MAPGIDHSSFKAGFFAMNTPPAATIITAPPAVKTAPGPLNGGLLGLAAMVPSAAEPMFRCR